ncbi:DUF2280 domain-containing protein [Sphingomonas sp. RB56-2]|uniref:DUF2280 domain-containing protein n=1 Tax=Sphingomonas brevis TaxID=2908206 RepID=A0ABT0SBG9_9SPHN|nr:DUF2280 domain-containing protein [Sphingomonas brevis]MCL6741769.1 DUF2280 domain-containing protein [Sphingomonas brevis]
MAALSDREKHAIVTLLAQFARPADVVVHMRNEFGIEIDRFQVRAYDPTNLRYEGGTKWRPIFEAARAAYLSSIEAVPIAHKAYRLNMLQRMLEATMAHGNYVLAASILRQAAREVGRGPAESAANFEGRRFGQVSADQTAKMAEIAKALAEKLQSLSADQSVQASVAGLQAA